MEKTQTTPWYKSKTIWIAIIQAVGTIVAAFYLQHPSIGALGMAKSIIDILTRLTTDTPIQS